jgi:hypothetical protein
MCEPIIEGGRVFGDARRKYSVQRRAYTTAGDEIVPTVAWTAALEKILCNGWRVPLH